VAAKFKKELLFDGFDPKAIYQMVPVTATREMAVVTDAEDCTIVIDPPNIARMEKFVFPKPLLEVPREFKAKVTPNNTLSFNIFGMKNGNTNLFLVNSRGVATSVMRISVKERLQKTFAVARLSDIRHLCPFLPEQIPEMLLRVKATFLQQANIELTQQGGQFDVTVPRNLGNPLILDAPTRDNFNAILAATPQAALVPNFCVYFCWDLRSNVFGSIVGQTITGFCFSEQQNNPFENAITVAHELGHAMGLNHTGAKSMMAGDGNSRSSHLQQFEIDTINNNDNAG
jgi:Metallo-peptidase family M12